MTASTHDQITHGADHPTVCLVIPVLNEQHVLADTIEKLIPFLDFHVPAYEIVIANNGSTDGPLGLAHQLASQHGCVKVIDLPSRGRGRAVRQAWQDSHADILAYMDVDLSTDVHTFPALIEPLLLGKADLATGSRLLRTELTNRSL